MKKSLSILLLLVLVIAAAVLSSCTDPLEAKAKKLDEAYVAMGTAYHRAIYLANLSGKIGNKEVSKNDESIQKKLDSWKNDIKDAKDVVAGWLDLKDQQMDDYIADWNDITSEIESFIDENFDGVESYVVTETETEAA